jgi:hypothetical protein
MCTAVLMALLAGCSAAIDPAAIAAAQTAARVKTALVNDREIGEFAIEVRVARGVVSLSGRVRSRAQAERAVDLARAVPGVSRVQPNLQVGGEPTPATAVVPEEADPGSQELSELDPGLGPGLLAIGASVGWSNPSLGALKQHVSFSPIVRFGSPRGVGPVLAFDWFRADLESVGGVATLARVHVRPLMGGVGYSLTSNRFSFTPSVVAGVAFNSLSITDTGVAEGLPVEVHNSFAWRAGASAWYEVGHRIAINATTGYLMTGFRLTVLQDGRLVRRDASGDTALLHVGVAYKLF